MREEWKDVPGYEGIYEISNTGLFIVLQTKRINNGRLQEAGVVEGDKTLTLSKEGQKPRRVFLAVLVLEVFVGPRPEGMECCHTDDDRTNNKLDNLRWDTHAANKNDAVRNGIANHDKGEKCRDAKLTDAVVLEARRIYAEGGWSYSRLAKRYGVSESVMYKAINKWTWKHI